MKKGCCKDRIAVIKSKSEQNLLRQIAFPPLNLAKSLPYAVVFYTFCSNLMTDETFTSFHHPPPLQRDIPLFLFHRTLLI